MSEPTGVPAATTTRDRLYWASIVVVLVADVLTKRWAERALQLHLPVDVFAPWLRWTLTYNTGAAMNLSLGGASRVVFSLIALGMVVYLFRLLRESPAHARATPLALGLITAGAIGNLIDRLRHTRGVVDFIDVGTAGWRFWTFNVADMGVTTGAILLALILWREGDPVANVPASDPSSPSPADDPAS